MPASLTAARTALAALLLAAPAVVVAAPAEAAEAAATACPWSQGAPPSNLNPYSSTDYAAGSAPIRVGPYGACTAVTTKPSGTAITVNCYVTNSYGNTWSYVRGSGWVYDGNLRNGGSTHPCRF
ncbi:hypothetical protein KV205_10225 [Streptomyces sp. SKN60]|uniref:hypothetical protein n=1 Tax=Streptomyces sp. SKN60 TaxID=2855506 RepID=UPI002245B96D|nr:hypothetical protein [Streptomyces sp. SKN60]MCX2180904.1 hypothetical protein [Streptomyces sp. SKN60]